ncbi:MAG TPA: ATP-binding protein [Geobacteraceae bacterium]
MNSTHHAPPHRSTPDTISRQQALLAADENLCAILDAMPELVMVLNENRQIVLGNTALATFANAKGRSEYVGMRPGELLSCHTAVSAVCGCGTGDECRRCGAVEAILAALQGHKAAYECRVLSQTQAGPEAFDLKVWGTPLRWRGEQLVLLVAVDISHEKRRQVLERLFFHDILNTAGAITMITGMLMDGIITFDEAKDDLWQTAQVLGTEIRGQRELLAAECNELRVNLSLLDPGEILESIAAIYRNNEAGKGRRIAIIVESAGLGFVSDRTLLNRVLGNLLKNALEASGEGETVTLGCRREGERLAFWCHNNAVMPDDVQLQVFQRSFSTKGSGRGIGTYSVKLLSEKYLQGRVTFTSSVEAGTTFTATYPIQPALG